MNRLTDEKATESIEPLGVLSLLVEGLFIGLWLAIFARPAKEVRMD
jgi:hypothetical protein